MAMELIPMEVDPKKSQLIVDLSQLFPNRILWKKLHQLCVPE